MSIETTEKAQPGTLPDFLIIGAQKAGTTALYRYLARHPGVRRPKKKETHFFDLKYEMGIDWYRTFFKPRGTKTVSETGRSRSLTFEATPEYLFIPHAAERVAEHLPWAKLVVLLRNPADRAYSHYNMAVALGMEDLSFEDALNAEDERLRLEAEQRAIDQSNAKELYWARVQAAWDICGSAPTLGELFPPGPDTHTAFERPTQSS